MTRAPFDVLCRVLRHDFNPDDVAAYSDADWEEFVALADAHGVAPLLHVRLRNSTGVPASIQSILLRHYYTMSASNALRLQELARLHDSLQAGGAPLPPLVLLKGAALAPTLYSDIALRPLNDIDVLVPRDALDRVVTAAQALGYHEYMPELNAGMDRVVRHHLHLRGGPDAGLALELHWSLIGGDTDRYTPDLGWFREQTESLPGDERTELLQLTPTAHLLYLSAHLMLQHGAGDARLIWFYDLHLLLTKEAERIHWDEMIARADEFHWAPALYAALTRTNALLSTALPEGPMAQLKSVALGDTAGRRRVARQAVQAQTKLMRVFARLSVQSWQARVRYAAGLLFPRPEYMRWRYQPEPAWLWPLCYPYRWARIIRDVLRTIGRVLQ